MRTEFKPNQYTKDIYTKLSYKFEVGRKLLDVGCGTGIDSVFLRENYGVDVYSMDIYRHENVNLFKLNFKKGSILKIPYPDKSFDYVFVHDVLHHIDEEHQSYNTHVKALLELKRVCKEGGTIIIIEGNRYNPLFYPHMVKILGHNHWRQGYFKNIIKRVFDNVEFRYFEAHLYPEKLFWLGKIYEHIIEKISPKMFLSYNVAIVNL